MSLGKQAISWEEEPTISPGSTFQRMNEWSGDAGRGPQKYTAFKYNEGSCLQSSGRCQRVEESVIIAPSC